MTAAVAKLPRALDGILAVDFEGPYGNYAGKLLHDLGAEVVLISPSSGSTAPSPGTADLDLGSLRFHYHNSGKRRLVVHPERPSEMAGLTELLASADLVLGNGTPEWPDRFGLTQPRLAEAAPQAVRVSITPFGLTGPYADLEATDLVCLAMGGMMSLSGYGTEQPLQVAGQQSYSMAHTYAAVAAMIALSAVEGDDVGEDIDVSIQESVATALENAPQYFDLEGVVRGRAPDRQRGAGAGAYRCGDGYVYLFVGGIASSRFWRRFVAWLHEAQVPGSERLAGVQWEDRAFLDSAAAQTTFLEVFEPFAQQHTKEWLYREAQQRGIPLTPIRTIPEVLASAQLRARGFFTETVLPDGRRAATPGAPYRLSVTPWRAIDPPSSAPPHLGAMRR